LPRRWIRGLERISTALSTIRLDLGASVGQLEWAVNAYNLSFAVLLITGAALGDRYGRRKLYAVGLGLFAAASAACTLAPDVGSSIGARAVQGAGAALLMPLGLAILSVAFPPERRGTAIGFFSAITGLAVASGPLIGGAVVEGISWEWIFWLNVPIGLLAIPLVLTRMSEKLRARHRPRHPRSGARHRRRARDRVGAGTRKPGRLGKSRGAGIPYRWGVARGRVRRLGAAGRPADATDALLPLPRLLGWQRSIFFTSASLFCAVFFYAQLLQTALGYGPLGAGLALVHWTATFITLAPIAGALADRIGERPLLVSGLV
jgi:MFS family permease